MTDISPNTISNLISIGAIFVSAGLSVYFSVINEKRKIYNNFIYTIKHEAFANAETIQIALTRLFNTYDFLKMKEYNIRIPFLEDIRKVRNYFNDNTNGKNSFEKIMQLNNQRGRNNILLDLYSKEKLNDCKLYTLLINIDIEHFSKTKEIIEKDCSNNEFFNAKNLKEEYDVKSNNRTFKIDNNGDKSILYLMHQACEYSTLYMELRRFYINFQHSAKRISILCFLGRDLYISLVILWKKIKNFFKNIDDFFIPIC